MNKKRIATSVALIALAGSSLAQNYNPRPGWKDSYSVDGVCYCDSNGFDHGADRLTFPTPAGVLAVTQICADIQSVLGEGRSSGRILYNDLQCGNGPPNDAGDEDPDACPGRVDIGPSGCQILGPKWDLEAVYGANPTTPVEPPPVETPVEPPTPSGVVATASRNSGNAELAIDNNLSTRWTTTQPQTPGQYFVLDLGEVRTINQVLLDSSNSPNDDPAGYSLAVSTNGRSYSLVASGAGTGGITSINFPSQSARFIRITQTGAKQRNWWSIHELRAALVETQSPSDTVDNGKIALERSGWTLVTSRNNFRSANAIDGKKSSRWTTFRQPQNGEQSFEIDLQSTQNFDQIVLDTSKSPTHFPREYRVSVSNTGNSFSVIATGTGNGPETSILFSPQNARYVRIEQTGFDDEAWWSIHEINLFR